MISKSKFQIFSLCAGMALCWMPASAASQNEWLTWGYDQERTGWNQAETALNKDNVSQLQLLWKSQLSTTPKETVLSTMTAPLVASVAGPQGPRTLVFVVGSDNTVYAIDSETGKVAWQKEFPNTLTPSTGATWLCSNTQNATPVIDKDAGIIYISTSDGKLRGLSIKDGEERLPPTDFTTPFARNWSLNLIDGVIYSPAGRGCGGAFAHFTALDLKDPARRRVEFYTSTGRPAGAWGRGGLVRGPKGVYAQTADGPYDPAAGAFGNTVLALNSRDLHLLDSYTPANWEFLNDKDQDLGSASPVVFPFQKWTLLASAAKESAIYLLDADNLGGSDHHTPLYQSPRWGNDEVLLAGRGLWGAMATWQDAQGRRWLLMPMWGPPSKDAPKFTYSYGNADEGSVMAFEVRLDSDKNKPELVPIWMSRDMHVPDPPVVANGVVYALQTGENTTQGRGATAKFRSTPITNAILYALDAETGRELYSSGKLIDSWTHFSEPVVAGGKIYVSTWDGRLYAFGLKK
ncbi:MAG: PQQ-binding-like beta-propeller repeat protein [Bryobacteraceae bacterium]